MNAADIRDASLIPGSGRSPAGGHGNPLQYSCLENPMTEESGGLHSTGSPSRTGLKWLNTNAHAAAQNQKWLSPQTRRIPDEWGSWVTSNGRARLIGDGEMEAPFDLLLHRRGENTEKSGWIPIRIVTASLIPINSQKILAPVFSITCFSIPSSV